jgi:NAD(P)H-flavin reductase
VANWRGLVDYGLLIRYIIGMQSLFCELLRNTPAVLGVQKLEFRWPGLSPRGGQFFMLRPERTSRFLGRPISVAGWDSSSVAFLVAVRGRGTAELAALQPGEKAELIGPLGNTWRDMYPIHQNIALVGGGIGIAPLLAFATELIPQTFDFYAGFKTGSFGLEGLKARSLILASDDGSVGICGRIPDVLESVLESAKYRGVYACGPHIMLKTVANACKEYAIPCFVSLERRMACGVGACLGCTVKTVRGNRRCCADGPIFKAEEVIFDVWH